MSVEIPSSQTNPTWEEERPGPAHYDTPDDEGTTFDPETFWTRRKVVAAVLGITATVTAGIGMGRLVYGGDSEAKPKTPPVATAPANPGEASPSTTPEVKKDSIDTMTRKNFPFTFLRVPGDETTRETFEGFNALKAKFALSAKEYANPKEAGPALIPIINAWLNYDLSPEQRARPDFQTHTFEQEPGTTYQGLPAVVREFVDTAFIEILTAHTDLAGTENQAREWIDSLKALAMDVQRLRNFTRDNPQMYRGELQLDSKPTSMGWAKSNDRPGIVGNSEFRIKYVDNANLNSVGEGLAVQEGTKYPKLWYLQLDSSGQTTTDTDTAFEGYWRVVSNK